MIDLRGWQERANDFAHEAKTLLGQSEGSYSARAYNVHDSLQKVGKLTYTQADAFKQSIRCVEVGLYRASFVMAWTALADLLLTLGAEQETEIKAVRTRWKFSDRETLAEEQGDHAIISALKEAKCISKSDMKSLHGLLHRRNQCAHPSGFFPGANEALGYVHESIASAEILVAKLDEHN